MKIHELLTEKKKKTDTSTAFSRLSAAARGEDPEFAPKAPEPKVAATPAANSKPVNYDLPTAQRKGKTIDLSPPEPVKPTGTVYTPTKPSGRQPGDVVRKGQNTLQWTGEPGKEWMIINGPLLTANPLTDRSNGIISLNGKRYLAAANAKDRYSVETR